MSRRWQGFVLYPFLAYALSYVIVACRMAESPKAGWAGFVLLVFMSLQFMSLLTAGAQVHEILSLRADERHGADRMRGPELGGRPRVSIHVPVCREPVSVVSETLTLLSKVDYPDFEVVVLCNNTPEPELWMPIGRLCGELGFRFFHLEHCPGFKAGALNFGLSVCAPDVEFVAVVDCDYHVCPDFLGHMLPPLLSSPSTAYVQARQDFRVSPASWFDRCCYHACSYFFLVPMRARAPRGNVIFAGTMGIVRRSVLAACGGWDEGCLAEDAEIGMRCAVKGYRGSFVPATYGRGLMPFDYGSLRTQRERWALGAAQVLAKYWRHLAWRAGSGEERGLTARQRFDYLTLFAVWFDAVAAVLSSALAFFIVASHAAFGIEYPVLAIASLSALGVVVHCGRFVVSLTREAPCTHAEAWGACWLLNSLTWPSCVAFMRGLAGRAHEFRRTPKHKSAPRGLVGAVSVVKCEFSFCVLGALAALSVLSRGPPWVDLAAYTALCLGACLPFASAVLICVSSDLRPVGPPPQPSSRARPLGQGRMGALDPVGPDA